MPIYEYECKSCGMRRDFLRKISDPPLTTCPECGKEALHKVLTAAGFQLKGSGWYATDFKGGSKPAAADSAETKTETKPDSASKTETAAAGTACGGSCTCH